ncbi:peptidyltRNA hydrolase domain containing protein [Acanthamoeba castellanii str. Neff]|uniref:PeptidyltRNA hydrolase domain containing protein n=1 Tax=Acanthamoeba castellanii (strain ATCC 30010 / Neff) TaxID=1257118 RepID=L8H204_ACACF|nr:peptidyltRNA hydrolase domain containing protein [Acanthamoeba castellanii str. Neff]ELR19242.1 peptidyltRNA hydrolase domain containing protein [Acanthamoeba castellanii str. Neff]
MKRAARAPVSLCWPILHGRHNLHMPQGRFLLNMSPHGCQTALGVYASSPATPLRRFSLPGTQEDGLSMHTTMNKSIQKRLDHMKHQFDDLSATLQTNEALSPEERGMLTKQLHALDPVMGMVRRIEQQREELRELHQLMEESKQTQDKELGALAEEDYKRILGELMDLEKELENEIMLELLGKDEADEKSAILEVRAAAGGQESQLFTMELFNMYSAYAEMKDWEWETLAVSDSEVGGYRESSACITGRGVFGRLKFETGVHRVQRVPETETQGRTHTSTVTVAVLPVAQEADIQILPKDIRVDTFRASGPGGQHVNKTDSANKDRAMKILRSRLYEIERERLASSRADQRRKQVGTGARHERIRTYNFPQSRITDHRCGLTVHDIESMMQGHHLDTFIDALVAHHSAEALNSIDLDSF